MKVYGDAGVRRVRKKRRVRGKFSTLVFLIVILMGAWYYLSHKPTVPVPIDMVGDIPVYEAFLPAGAAARPGEKRQVQWIVIHETDNEAVGAGAENHSRYLLSNGWDEKKSWHYTVDDHEIYHHLPDDENAYHAGDGMEEGGGNKNGIGIELCVNADGDYEKTLQNAVQLTAKLMWAYDLSIDHVKKHQDFSGKICPDRLINNDRWGEFLEKTQGAYAEICKNEG